MRAVVAGLVVMLTGAMIADWLSWWLFAAVMVVCAGLWAAFEGR